MKFQILRIIYPQVVISLKVLVRSLNCVEGLNAARYHKKLLQKTSNLSLEEIISRPDIREEDLKSCNERKGRVTTSAFYAGKFYLRGYDNKKKFRCKFYGLNRAGHQFPIVGEFQIKS